MSNPRQIEERIMQILKRISNPKPATSQKFKKLTNNLNIKLIKISEEFVYDTTVSIAYKKKVEAINSTLKNGTMFYFY